MPNFGVVNFNGHESHDSRHLPVCGCAKANSHGSCCRSGDIWWYIYIYKLYLYMTYIRIYLSIISINGLIYIICTYCAEVPILVATRLPFLVPDRTHAIRVGHGNFIPVFRHETRDPSYGQHGNGVNPLTNQLVWGGLPFSPPWFHFSWWARYVSSFTTSNPQRLRILFLF